MSQKLRIGTRGSKLALWQAHWTQDRLAELRPDLEVTLEIVKTTGDTIQDRPLAALNIQGAFTRELDRALLGGEVDLVVHSLKDVPTEWEPDILLAAVTEREDPRDVFIGKEGITLDQVPQGGEVATSSRRRCAQLRALRPDLKIVDIRGNVDTRLRKLQESESLQGTLLALAGVRRLGLEAHVSEVLDTERFLPAPGQAALGIATRHDDTATVAIAALLNHPATQAATTAERSLLNRLEGGCRVPIGALGSVDGDQLFLDALIAHPETGEMVRRQASGVVAEAAALGRSLADTLQNEGGAAILEWVRTCDTV